MPDSQKWKNTYINCHKQNLVVEVFKTNIDGECIAKKVLQSLSEISSSYKINFDLEDCDRILRVESDHISIDKIKETVQNMGLLCEVLA